MSGRSCTLARRPDDTTDDGLGYGDTRRLLTPTQLDQRLQIFWALLQRGGGASVNLDDLLEMALRIHVRATENVFNKLIARHHAANMISKD